ncbi:MAG: GNAT family N-acetyltransferase [Phycisphaerales bacterium]
MYRGFAFKKTCELSRGERDNLRALFSDVFGKSLTEEHFDRKYLRTPLGYSYHGLMTAEDAIVGAYNVIPYEYDYFGRRVLFGLSVDTMIGGDCRGGPFSLREMATLVYDAMRRDNLGFVFGFPNEMAYEYTKRLLRWNDIGELDFYVLPRRISAIVPKLAGIDWLGRLVVAGSLRLPWRGRPAKAHVHIEKICNGAFEEHRYDGDYSSLAVSDGGECTYRLCTEERGIRVLYIVDVHPLRADALREAVRGLYRRHARSIDMMLYVGDPSFDSGPLIRVPKSRRPCRVRMCGRILTPGMVDERVFQMENWSVNLSNFDVR